MPASAPSAPKPGPYPELAAIAAWLGVPHAGTAELVFSRESIVYTVSLELDSGSVCGLSLQASRAGLPEVTLRPETASDRRGKERGISVEAQTGDAAFDTSVYVETDLPDEAARALLAPPAIRRAVLDLLRSFRSVELTPRGVSATTRDLRPELFDPTHFAPVFEAFRAIASISPPGPAPAPSRRGFWLLMGMVLGFPLSLAGVIAAEVAYPPEAGWVWGAGAAAGIAAWAASRPLVRAWVQGHSRSYGYYVLIGVISFIDLPLLGNALLVGLNGMLDMSRLERRTGVLVEAVPYLDDSEPWIHGVVEWGDKSRLQRDFKDEGRRIRKGDQVTFVRHRGAFGLAWGKEPAVAPAGGGGKGR
jgi:hypothetical protein